MTTNYIPASWVQPSALMNIVGPALFIPTRVGDQTLLITGGTDPQAIMLDGSYAGRAFRVAQSGSRVGMAIHEVDVEIDLSSAVDRQSETIPHRSVAILDGDLHIIANTKDRNGFDDIFAWNLRSGAAVEYFSEALVFPRWRLCKMRAAESLEIYSISAAD